MKQTLCFSSGRSAMCLTLLVLTQSSLLVVIQANNEGDALHSFRRGVQDPSGVLQSWDPSLVNPCTWFHVTCDQADRVIRVDLGNSMLSGFISPALGNLSKLRYLELYSNNFSGIIPETLGNLTELVSLDLYLNTLTGSIPSSLGNLLSLETLRLNNNSLTGDIPMSLTTIEDLQVLDLSSNQLYGEVPSNGSFSLFTPLSFADNPGLCGKIVGKQCPGGPPIPAPAPDPAPFEDNGDASSPTSGADD